MMKMPNTAYEALLPRKRLSQVMLPNIITHILGIESAGEQTAWHQERNPKRGNLFGTISLLFLGVTAPHLRCVCHLVIRSEVCALSCFSETPSRMLFQVSLVAAGLKTLTLQPCPLPCPNGSSTFRCWGHGPGWWCLDFYRRCRGCELGSSWFCRNAHWTF